MRNNNTVGFFQHSRVRRGGAARPPMTTPAGGGPPAMISLGEVGRGRRGFSLVEIVVAVAIFASLVSGITFLATGSYAPFVGVGDSRQADRLAREALDSVDIIKNLSWTVIDANDGGTSVKAVKDTNGNWTIAAGTETLGSFTRDIKIATVQRDGSDVIVTSGGTDDPSTKKITVTISASGRVDYVLESYIVNQESYRMSQTDWSGSAGTDIWTDGSTDYSTKTTEIVVTGGQITL